MAIIAGTSFSFLSSVIGYMLSPIFLDYSFNSTSVPIMIGLAGEEIVKLNKCCCLAAEKMQRKILYFSNELIFCTSQQS